MTILSDREIREELEKGNINIDPFDSKQVQPNGYDFRLGEWFCSLKRGSLPYNPYKDPGMWEEPQKARRGSIFFRPDTTILCHTQEVMGGLVNITTEMKTRSSMARIGIDVCKSAGVGDVGYNNIWTLEVTNTSHRIIELPVGCRIGQMLFLRTGPTEKTYAGSYLQKPEWDPSQMLPKFNADNI